MNEEDTSLYGKNREGKVALCETCAYDGYCRDSITPTGRKVSLILTSLKTMLGSVLRLLSEVRLSCVLCTRRHVKCSTASGCRI